MTVQTFTFNPLLTNCYLVYEGTEALLVDPGCQRASEVRTLLKAVEQAGVTVRQILLTHAHFDHIFGLGPICDALGVGFWLHRSDDHLITHAVQQAASFGIPMQPPPRPAGYLDEADTLSLGASSWQILHTPGHSPGSICFYDAREGFVISGDVLFYDSIGRTDLWKGSLPQLMTSIFQKLIPLGDAVVVYPGHGPQTTIGRERTSNPFLVANLPG